MDLFQHLVCIQTIEQSRFCIGKASYSKPENRAGGSVAYALFRTIQSTEGIYAFGKKQTIENLGHSSMRCRFVIILSVFFATCTLADDDPLASLKKGQSKDVSELVDRFVGCNHWSGEEPYDAERKQEILSAISDLKCAQLAKDEAAARKRYANKPATIKALQRARETSF